MGLSKRKIPQPVVTQLIGLQLSRRSGDQLQVVGFIGNRLIAKSADDRPLAQKENARHLVRVFLDHAKTMLANGALQPRFPDFSDQEVGKGTLSREVKDRLGDKEACGSLTRSTSER